MERSAKKGKRSAKKREKSLDRADILRDVRFPDKSGARPVGPIQ
jgi:hypothetical protein